MTAPTLIDSYPLNKYAEAFCMFAKCKESDIKIKKLDTHALVFYNDETYMVSRLDDFKREYRSYFEADDSYNDIYLQMPEQVWRLMLEENDVDLTLDEFIMGLYRQWNIYWDSRREQVPNKAHYEKLKKDSWRDLQILIEASKIDFSMASVHANNIDHVFVSMIALVLKEKYADFEQFLDDVVDWITGSGFELLTHGDTFEIVTIGDNEETEELFYIYNPSFEWSDEIFQS